MEITYIGHSGFLVELEHSTLLFDYWQGDFSLPAGKKPYIFASHRHPDHFNPEIFKLQAAHPDIQFVLSDDIWQSRVPAGCAACTVRLGPNAHWEDGALSVRTLKSTDEGVAFCVQCEGKHLYHAGDLNDWQWRGEPEYWNRQMAENFRKNMEPLRGQSFDAAFIPLDPRQEEDYDCGLNYFLTIARAEKIYPMHCWEDYSVTGRWLADHPDSPNRGKIVPITRRGEQFSQ